MGTIRKVVYGKEVVNYEWVQKYLCGCKKHVAISALQKGAYKRAIKERRKFSLQICCRCYLRTTGVS